MQEGETKYQIERVEAKESDVMRFQLKSKATRTSIEAFMATH